MKKTMLMRFHFIYEVDNIPNYRSRSFGCCPCQMAVRKFGLSQNKKPYQGGNPNTARRKINLSNNQSMVDSSLHKIRVHPFNYLQIIHN